MPRGGSRPGAGRKTNAEIATMRSLLNRNVTDPQWDKLLSKLYDLALKGNLRAAQLLITYRFGDPNAPEPAPEPPPISFIEVVSPPEKIYCPECPYRDQEEEHERKRLSQYPPRPTR